MNKRVVKKIFSLLLMFVFCMLMISCGEQNSNKIDPTHVHSYSVNVVESTCEEQGYTIYTCSCGHSYKDNYTQKKNHDCNSETIKNATCNQKGEKKYSCKYCEYNYIDTYELEKISANEIYEKANKSVCEIVTYNKSGAEIGLGSGFVYKSNGEIITNYHVMEKVYSAKVTINDKTYSVKKILSYNKDKDLIILKIDASNLLSIKICTEDHSVGTSVYALGSSRGLTSTFSQGIITTADRIIDGVHYVQHDAAISNGNSGGPLINHYGEIIGVNTMTIRDSQNLNFAVSVKELSSLNYGNSLSVSQFYEKEFDIISNMKNYIKNNGTYDYEDNEYEYMTGWYSVSSGSSMKYQTIGYYDVDNNELELAIAVGYGSSLDMIFITIDEIDGTYDYVYLSSNGGVIVGTIYATTWTTNSILGVTSYSGYSYSSTFTTDRKFASNMVDILLEDIEVDYSDIGVTAYDLLFYNI